MGLAGAVQAPLHRLHRTRQLRAGPDLPGVGDAHRGRRRQQPRRHSRRRRGLGPVEPDRLRHRASSSRRSSRHARRRCRSSPSASCSRSSCRCARAASSARKRPSPAISRRPDYLGLRRAGGGRVRIDLEAAAASCGCCGRVITSSRRATAPRSRTEIEHVDALSHLTHDRQIMSNEEIGKGRAVPAGA